MSYLTDVDILAALEKAEKGTRRVMFTFRRGEESDIIFLWGMRKKGMILFEENGNKPMDILVSSITNDRSFVGEENFSIRIVLTDKFDANYFITKVNSSSFMEFEVVE